MKMLSYNKINAVLLLLILGLAPIIFNTSLAAVETTLTIANREGTARTAEPITSGIPFAQGVLTDKTKVRLLDNGVEIPAQFRVTANWPDGSIRWLLMDFQLNLPASGSAKVTLKTGTSPTPFSGISYTDTASQLTVNTGAASFQFNKNELFPANRYFQVTSGGIVYRAVPNSGAWSIEESGPMKVVVKIEGRWFSGGTQLKNNLVGFRARLFFFRNKNSLRIQFTFKNNNGFGWYGTRGATVTLNAAEYGIPLLAAGGSYEFGQGVEKTWEIDIPASGSPVNRDSRYTATGNLASGFTAPRPLAAASPAYYSSTHAWGPIIPPLTGFPTEIQADFDLYEKIQRGKAIQADVEDPPGKPGISLWGHLTDDLGSWNDYGDLRWGGGCGPFSGNHYDWVYGMLLHFLRTGRMEFLDAGRVFAKHEIDFDLYHTGADGEAYNYQKNWESRPSHTSPDNCFGGGRPSHTWTLGYGLYWLLTGDPRGKDAVDELEEGLRQYVYESFNYGGYIDTNEIRIQGWLCESLLTLWRINPKAVLDTSQNGKKTIPQAFKDILKSVFDLEAAAGKKGYIYAEYPPDPNLSQPLMNCYFLEPAIHAYEEVFKNRDNEYAANLLGLIKRMTSWLMSVTYGGDSNQWGHYRPRQVPYMVDRTLAQQTEGQVPYILMALNAAAFCYTETGIASYRDYMRPAFRDYVRYLGVAPGDYYVENPAERTATSFNSSVYPYTEPKVHGWGNRYGQYYLAAEAAGQGGALTVTYPNGGEYLQSGTAATITWTSTGNINQVKIQYSTNNGGTWTTIAAAVGNTGSKTWQVPAVTSSSCRIRISSVENSSIKDDSDGTFSIGGGGTPALILSRNHLDFAAVGASVTGTQEIFVGNAGSGVLNWTATTTTAWLTLSPASASGNGTLRVTANAANLAVGTANSSIIITATNAVNSPQTVTVTLNKRNTGSGPFGSFDTPVEGASVSGSIPVTGWALDDLQVSEIKIIREPVSGEGSAWVNIGTAVFVEGQRPDVEQAYPGIPFNYRGGWGYMLLTYGLPNRGMSGTVRLRAVAVDVEGNSTILGTRTIHCDNSHAVKPFGAIDSPAQGGIASGKTYNCRGWVLTPPPNRIPTDGSTIFAWIDGVKAGRVTYNQYRADIAGLFPEYANRNGAGGVFILDTTKFSNGVHTIYWTATDNAGNTDGIGSRYFTIQN